MTTSASEQQGDYSSYVTMALRLTVPLILLLVNIIFVAYQYNTHILDADVYLSDEVINWQQVKGFAEYGFNTGYYIPNENVAPASFTPFYVHGPWYTMLYGTVASVVGWQFYSPVIFNTVLLVFALYLLIFSMRLDIKQLLVLAGVLLVSFPIHLYINIAMQESLNQAIAIILAIIFYRLLSDDKVSLVETIAYGAFLFCVTLMRLSWGILILPFFILINGRSIKSLILSVAQSGITSVAAYLLVQQVTPAGNHSVFNRLGQINVSPLETIQELIDILLSNAARYYDFVNKNILDSVQSATVSGLIVLLISIALILFWVHQREGRRPSIVQKFSFDELAFHLYNLSLIHIASFALYIIATWGDYRVIFAHLLLVLIIMILRRNFALVILFVVINLFVFPILPQHSDIFIGEKFPSEINTPANIALATVLNDNVVFDTSTDNRWCNTMLISRSYLDDMGYVPVGIGTALLLQSDTLVNQPIQSRYLWLSQADFDMSQSLKLTLLGQASSGFLMLNEDSDCIANPSNE